MISSVSGSTGGGGGGTSFLSALWTPGVWLVGALLLSLFAVWVSAFVLLPRSFRRIHESLLPNGISQKQVWRLCRDVRRVRSCGAVRNCVWRGDSTTWTECLTPCSSAEDRSRSRETDKNDPSAPSASSSADGRSEGSAMHVPNCSALVWTEEAADQPRSLLRTVLHTRVPVQRHYRIQILKQNHPIRRPLATAEELLHLHRSPSFTPTAGPEESQQRLRIRIEETVTIPPPPSSRDLRWKQILLIPFLRIIFRNFPPVTAGDYCQSIYNACLQETVFRRRLSPRTPRRSSPTP